MSRAAAGSVFIIRRRKHLHQVLEHLKTLPFMPDQCCACAGPAWMQASCTRALPVAEHWNFSNDRTGGGQSALEGPAAEKHQPCRSTAF